MSNNCRKILTNSSNEIPTFLQSGNFVTSNFKRRPWLFLNNDIKSEFHHYHALIINSLCEIHKCIRISAHKCTHNGVLQQRNNKKKKKYTHTFSTTQKEDSLLRFPLWQKQSIPIKNAAFLAKRKR